MGKLEKDFVKNQLKPELERRFPGCMILKQDPNMRQGVPDHLVLYEDKWAALETKKEPSSARQPNQPHYVHKMNEMSFSAFVNPANMDEVLDEMERSFRPGR